MDVTHYPVKTSVIVNKSCDGCLSTAHSLKYYPNYLKQKELAVHCKFSSFL